MRTTWVLESGVHPHTHPRLREVLAGLGCGVVDWRDAWAHDGPPALLGEGRTVFHGSLENADRVQRVWGWRPGSFCDTEAFCCSAWYGRARPWLLHPRFHFTTVAELVADPAAAAEAVGAADRLFVRPDSPLKPSGGQALATEAVSLATLDHGFYYEDEQLPVVVAPVQRIDAEWRFVVAGGRVVAGSAAVEAKAA